MPAPPNDDTHAPGVQRGQSPPTAPRRGGGGLPGRIGAAGSRWSEQLAHSRRVRQAKVALPILAGLTLMAVALWPLVRETTQPRHADVTGQVAMADAHYLGLDKHGRPIELRAASAQQIAGSDKLYNLTAPETEITLKGGQWVTLSSDKGTYDQTSGHLSMSGHVTLIHDKGYEFTTETAEVDTQHGIAWGNDRIAGQGSFGDIDAGGFRVGKDGDSVVFTGKARLRLFEAARKSGGLRDSSNPEKAAAPVKTPAPGKSSAQAPRQQEGAPQ